MNTASATASRNSGNKRRVIEVSFHVRTRSAGTCRRAPHPPLAVGLLPPATVRRDGAFRRSHFFPAPPTASTFLAFVAQTGHPVQHSLPPVILLSRHDPRCLLRSA